MPGCQLPESLRQYYLDVIGITHWQLQNPSEPAQPVEESAAIVAAQSPASAAQEVSSWDSLQQQVASCQRCEQLAASRTQTVFGVGAHDANVLVIGEAPGRDEDAQGEPFVGRAGQLLNAMLQAVGLQREQVYIANILKCRPPNNRDPSTQEALNCREFLQAQITLIAPKVILVVGRIAAQNLLACDTPIGKMRGQDYRYSHESLGDIPVIVTYHPAYLLRSPGEKRKSWQDLLRLKRMMQSWH